MNLETVSNFFPGAYLWRKDINSQYIEVTAATAKIFGFRSVEQMLGVSDENVPCKMAEFYEVFQREDRRVMETGQPKKFIEIMCCANDEWRIFLVCKKPEFNHDKTVGTLGFCIDVTSLLCSFMPNYINAMQRKNLQENAIQQSYVVTENYDELNLTPRQSHCLFYLLRGMSYKQIASNLKISPRTVENHIEFLKTKFASHTKSELIEAARLKGYEHFIPVGLLKTQASMSLVV